MPLLVLLEKAFIFRVQPFNGCNIITPAPTNNSYFAIMDRGDCNFILKVDSAQRSGFLGAIVINYDDDLFHMDSDRCLS